MKLYLLYSTSNIDKANLTNCFNLKLFLNSVPESYYSDKCKIHIFRIRYCICWPECNCNWCRFTKIYNKTKKNAIQKYLNCNLNVKKHNFHVVYNYQYRWSRTKQKKRFHWILVKLNVMKMSLICNLRIK